MEQVGDNRHVSFARQPVRHGFVELVNAANVKCYDHRRDGGRTRWDTGVHFHVLAVYFECVRERRHNVFPPQICALCQRNF